jgi:hypothetical protein
MVAVCTTSPSQARRTELLAGNPVPETRTAVPGATADGVEEIRGPAASLLTMGMTSTPTPMIMMRVAAISLTLRREGCGAGVGERGTQRLPSQNDIVRLHSATRLAT